MLVVTQRRAYRLGHATLETAHRLFDLLSSHFASVKLAKAFAIERRLERDFAARSEDFRKAGVALQVDAARSALLQELAVVALLVAAVTASVGVFRVASGELVVLIAVFSRLLPLVLGLNGGIRSLAGALPEHDELVDIEARARAASEPLADPGQRLPLTQAITLEDVSFAYPDTPGAPILDRVSLLVLAGTATGIIGASGAGKSTLLDVIAGLLAPTSGIVRIDGRSIDESLRPVWRAGITYVPQDAPLIHDTLRANLLIGNPEATDAEMWRVLELVGAAALVRGMADGLDTLAGDRGVRLSGGERQRLRLASALLRMPPVLILDEATSALSPADEAPIIAALGELRGRSTIVTVAHRESSVAWTDQVVSVSHGRLYCVALPGSVTASRADGSGAGTSAQGRLVMDIEAPRLPTHGKS